MMRHDHLVILSSILIHGYLRGNKPELLKLFAEQKQ
jgi:hypothetical protein